MADEEPKSSVAIISARQRLAALPPEELRDPSVLVPALEELFNSPNYQPPVLPSIGIELMEVSKKPNVEFKEILALLEKDPLIAGRILKISQSPVYASRAKILSLHDALVRLGLDTVTNIFFEAFLHMKVFRAKGYEAPLDDLRRHSALVAQISRAICRRIGIQHEYAFLVGLLHDIGIAAAVITIGETVKRPPPFKTIWPAVDAAHEFASGRLGILWQLPEEVTDVIAHHHNFVVDGHPNPVGAVVCLADQLAIDLGVGFEPVNEQLLAHATESLFLKDVDLKHIKEEARRTADQRDASEGAFK